MGELLHHIGRRHQGEVVETARPRIQQTETILARRDTQYGFDPAIHCHLVAQHALRVDLVIEQLAASVETPVIEVQRIVIWMTGQTQSSGARIGLAARVQLIEQAVETGQPQIKVGRREVQGVVVVEERTQSLGGISLKVLAGLESGLHIGVQVILEPAVGRQGRTVLAGTVVVARETVAFRTAVQVVQVGGDFRRTEPHVVLRQLVMDATD
ncbi:hypothetical protein D3C81_1302880 [compost metagenome]